MLADLTFFGLMLLVIIACDTDCTENFVWLS